MNTVLWIVQAMLGFAFLMVGAMKIMQPYEKFKGMMPWVEDFSPAQVKGIGVLEIMGAMGVILPWVLGLYTFMTPLAAFGLGLVMVGAGLTHIRRKESNMLVINIALLMMALFVAYGRFFL